LDGFSNNSPWKERIMLDLMENKIWEFDNTQITPPIDVAELVIHNQKDVKSRCIILDGVNDHLIPHLLGNTIVRDVWEALNILFQIKNENQKMVMREKHRYTNVIGSYIVTSYLTYIRHVRDELAAIGDIVNDSELVRMALKFFMKQWTLFIKGIVSHGNLPNWSRLWDDFIQEEL
jgi:hypothetical protein